MPIELSAAIRGEIDALAARYPRRSAALLPALHAVQRELGHLPDEALLAVAEVLDVPPTRVLEVVSFYEMYHRHAEGQFNLELCTNIACHLMGADRLMEHLKARLGVEVGHQTEDGVFKLSECECLASCGTGPTMRVGEDYYEELDAEAVDRLLAQLRGCAPSLGGRPYAAAEGGPHTGVVPEGER